MKALLSRVKWFLNLAITKSLLSAIGIILLYSLFPTFCLFFGQVLAGASDSSEIPQNLRTLMIAIGSCMSVVFILNHYVVKKKQNLSDVTGIHPRGISVKERAYMWVTGLLLGLAVSAGLSLLPESLRNSYDEASLKGFASEGREIAYIIALFVSPVTEEILFRGIILGRMRRGLESIPRGNTLALAATSALFGLMHWHPFWIAYAALFGLLFGYIDMRRENTANSLWMHLGFNFNIIPILLLANDQAAPLYITLPMFLVLGGAGGYLLYRFLKHTKSEIVL